MGQLSASIALEIRNPLAAIVQANDLIMGSSGQQQAILHQMISKQAVRINSIIKDTLDMAKNRKTTATKIHLQNFLNDLLINDLQDARQNIQLDVQTQLFVNFDDVQLPPSTD